MKIFYWMGILATLILSTSAVYAAGESAEAPVLAPAAAQGMDPAMEKMKALTSPSEKHKALEPFAGNWTYSGKFWMSPEAAPQEMTGTAQNRMVFGGRFLRQDFEGPWMGETFQGLGFTGYDNVKEEYVSVWLDGMSTGIMTSSGQYDAEKKMLTLSGANSCPMTGEKDRVTRSEWALVDDKHTTYTSYMAGPDGNEFKSMEINYTRAT